MKIRGGKAGKTALIAAAAILISALAGCNKNIPEYSSFAMGSILTAKIYAESEEDGKKIYDEISGAVSEADSFLSATKEDSDISILNERGKYRVDDYTAGVLKDSVQLCNSLGRKTDITMGAVTELWGFAGDSPSKPDDDSIKEALGTVDIEKFEIRPDNNTVTLGEGQKLDLGAFGKGAACDACFDVLAKYNKSAVVTLGGTVLVYGEGPSDGMWNVGIRNPAGAADDYFAALAVSPYYPKNAAFISTSGSYEKTFEYEGVKYHHILSAETGYPVESELLSVTVVSPSGINSDALSTACFINGFNEETLKWLEYYGADAVFVFNDNTYSVTEGLSESFTLVSDGYSPREGL